MAIKEYKIVWDMLDLQYLQMPRRRACPANAESIEEAEKKISLPFSPYYKKFLLKYGGGSVDAYDIFGLSRSESMPTQLWSVIDNTKFYKEAQKWPGIEDWYVISDDGCGNPIGIDPEGRVWLSDHDSGFEKIKLADDFEEFLYRLYTETLYEE